MSAPLPPPPSLAFEKDESTAEQNDKGNKFKWIRRPRRRPVCDTSDLTDDEWVIVKRRRYWFTKTVPALVAGLVAYSIYVHAYVLSWRYLHNNDSSSDSSRAKIGVAFIVISSLLAIGMLTCSLLVNVLGPGLVPLGWETIATDHFDSLSADDLHMVEDNDDDEDEGDGIVDQNDDAVGDNGLVVRLKRMTGSPMRLDAAFVCEMDGYPKWCSRCQSTKPDRSHHSSELDRCVLKMDHYCPWLGSIIGFRNYKAFYHFVVYSLAYLIFVFVTLLRYTISYGIEHRRTNPQFIIILAICLIMLPLLAGFAFTHTKFILRNVTTIEHLNRYSRTYFINMPLSSSTDNQKRCVAEQEVGAKLWNVGLVRNWKSVMGQSWIEWFVPIDLSGRSGLQFEFDPERLAVARTRARSQPRSKSQ
ncbi:DHHC palmitoyltransferase-domain-containing protein [Lipomyces japonicus]|uniref:DHHC palmitoyltransferase-domain-containing protein n=1 Tax=Lipomyces japonicus TaxID=56871 RepID=UPI0034CE7DE9